MKISLNGALGGSGGSIVNSMKSLRERDPASQTHVQLPDNSVAHLDEQAASLESSNLYFRIQTDLTREAQPVGAITLVIP